MFEEHDQIRQAATECMCNLVTCKEVRIDSQPKCHISVITGVAKLTNFNYDYIRSKNVIWKTAMIG